MQISVATVLNQIAKKNTVSAIKQGKNAHGYVDVFIARTALIER